LKRVQKRAGLENQRFELRRPFAHGQTRKTLTGNFQVRNYHERHPKFFPSNHGRGFAVNEATINEIPQWVAVRDTVGPHNNIFMAGAIVRSREKPGHDFVRLGAVVEPSATLSNSLTEDRPPQAGLVRVGTDHTGAPRWSRNDPSKIVEVASVPLWKLRDGVREAFADGAIRRAGECWRSDIAVIDSDVLAVNDAAQQLLNRAKVSSHTPAAPVADPMPPRFYSRDADDPKYHRGVR
jgi:hypothetical protein